MKAALLTIFLVLPHLLYHCAASTVVAGSAGSTEQDSDAGLSDTEKQIRHGIVLLGKLCQCMAAVKDNDTAEAAVPEIMRLSEAFRQWPQGFTKLPPVSGLEALTYEERYMPTIRKINHIIEAQAGRLAAAEYYGSRNLAAALVRLAQTSQP
ncbi:MAG: hypothetical protein IKA23_07675 [Akkermansia sp.]|nr:hypothetical protein [Akkermansia sp.]MBR2314520.1 hypothetical protein [Akkermansia sp.]